MVRRLCFFLNGHLWCAAFDSALEFSIDLLFTSPDAVGSWFLVPAPSLQTEKREWDTQMTRLQREADRLRATLWSHGINPVSNVAGSNTNTNTNPAANVTKSLAPKGSHRGPNNGHGRRRDGQHLDTHRHKKKLAPLSHLGGGSSSSSFGGGNNSSTASAAVIGFRSRVGDFNGQVPRGWRHK